MKQFIKITGSTLLALALLFGFGADKVNAQTSTQNRFILVSDPKSYVGQGKNLNLVNSILPVTNYPGDTYISFNIKDQSGNWHLDLSAPGGKVPKVGFYDNATSLGVYEISSSPTINFFGQGRANSSIRGSFTVYELEYTDGQISKAAIDFTQNYTNAIGTDRGQIRYNSSYPISSTTTTSTVNKVLSGACISLKTSKTVKIAEGNVVIGGKEYKYQGMPDGGIPANSTYPLYIKYLKMQDFDGVYTPLPGEGKDGADSIKVGYVTTGKDSLVTEIGNVSPWCQNYSYDIETSATSTLRVSSPYNNEILNVGVPINIIWGGVWNGNDSFSIVERSVENGKSVIVDSIAQWQAVCPGIGKSVCSWKWTPKLVSNSSQITVSTFKTGNRSQELVGYSGTFKVSTSTSNPNSIVSGICVSPDSLSTFKITSGKVKFGSREYLYMGSESSKETKGFINRNYASELYAAIDDFDGKIYISSSRAGTIKDTLSNIKIATIETQNEKIGDFAMLRMINNVNPSCTDYPNVTSSDVISTTSKPTLNVLSPNGGEVYKVGDTVNIRWESKNLGNLKIWLTLLDENGTSIGDGTVSPKLNAVVPNTGGYLWKIPNNVLGTLSSKKFKINASTYDDGPSAYDSSNSSFTVVSSSESSSINIPCYTFNKDLSYGDEGKDVDSLIKILIRDGSIINPDNLTVKGETYDTNVVSGVVVFQGKYGISQTGYVGPITRAKLNGLYGCSSSTDSSTKIYALPIDNGTRPSHKISLVDNGTQAPYQADFTFNFIISNYSNNDIYISKDGSKALVTSVEGTATSTIQSPLTRVTPASAQDTRNSYVIAAGQSRVFEYNGILDNGNGLRGTQSIAIKEIKYGLNDTSTNSYGIKTDIDKFKTPSLTLSPSSNNPQVTVISPNGGDVLTEGTFNTIKWSTTGFKNTDKVQIEIWDGRRTCPANDPACLRGGGIIATNISNTGSYTWNTTLPGLSTYYGKTNQAVYKIRVIASEYPPTERTTSTSDWSDRYFSIIPSIATTSTATTSSSSISRASISGVCVLSSPSESQIEIGRAYAITSGKLKFNNKDYSFDGYRGYGLPSNKIMPVYLYSPYEGRIFSYVYSNSPVDIGNGTTTALKVGTIITGNEGAIRNIYNVDPSCPTYADISAKATSEATVADQIINVTSPSAGDTWTLGDTKTIRWTYPKELAGKTISLYVNLSNGKKAWEIFSSKEMGVSVNPNSRGEVPWSALKFNNIQSGAYKIEVSMTDRSNFKNYMLYSKMFNVVNPVIPSTYEENPTATPTSEAKSAYIRVISPNGGERIPAGSVYRIKWSSNGVPNRVNIAMVNFGSNGERYGGSEIVTVSASQGYYDWTVPNSQGYWKIVISQPLSESRSNVNDESNYVFAIVAPEFNTYTPTPTATYSYTPYPSETYKATPTATYTYTPAPTYTYTPSPTYSSTPSTSASPSYTYSPSPSSSSSASPSYSPSYSPSSSPVSFIDDFRMSLGAAIIDAVRNMFGI